MNTSVKPSKDNVLMITLVAASLVMATLGSALTSQEADAVIDSASSLAQSVSTPTAMQPILYREAAIIVTAPRLHRAA